MTDRKMSLEEIASIILQIEEEIEELKEALRGEKRSEVRKNE